MKAREVIGLEAALFWLTLGLFALPRLPWRRLIREYVREIHGGR